MSAPGWPAELMLVRHAESVGNVADARAHAELADELDLDVRDADVELSPVGRRQARALGDWIASLPAADHPDVVLSSPYRRAADTARLAASVAGLQARVHLDERLRERDLGRFDGLTGRGIRARYAEEARRRSRLGKFYYRPPGGESWADVALRIRSVLRDIREEHEDCRVVVVTHQAVVMLFRYVLEGLTEAEVLDIDRRERIANAAVTHYVGDRSGLRLQSFNVTHYGDHLETAEASADAAAGSPTAQSTEPSTEEPRESSRA